MQLSFRAVFFIIINFSCENIGNAYKNFQNTSWVEKIKQIELKTIKFNAFQRFDSIK